MRRAAPVIRLRRTSDQVINNIDEITEAENGHVEQGRDKKHHLGV